MSNVRVVDDIPSRSRSYLVSDHLAVAAGRAVEDANDTRGDQRHQGRTTRVHGPSDFPCASNCPGCGRSAGPTRSVQPYPFFDCERVYWLGGPLLFWFSKHTTVVLSSHVYNMFNRLGSVRYILYPYTEPMNVSQGNFQRR